LSDSRRAESDGSDSSRCSCSGADSDTPTASAANDTPRGAPTPPPLLAPLAADAALLPLFFDMDAGALLLSCTAPVLRERREWRLRTLL